MTLTDLFQIYLPMYVIPVISIAVTYYFGLKTKEKDLKVESLKIRYEKLYEPFLQLTVESWEHVKIPTSFPDHLLDDFMRLFNNNIGQLGSEALSFYPQMYESYLFYTFEKAGHSQFKNTDARFNMDFTKFCNLITKECSTVREKLGYPKLTKRFYDAYGNQNCE